MKLQELRESWVDRFYDEWYPMRSSNKTLKDFQKALLQHGIFMPINSAFVKKHLGPAMRDIQGAMQAHLETIPAEYQNVPEIRAAIRLGATQFILVNFPRWVMKTTKLSDMSDRFWSSIRHELTHSQQPAKFLSSDGEYHMPDRQPIKLLRYMVQSIERGPHAMDIAQELASLDKTPEDMQAFIKRHIGRFREDRQHTSLRPWYNELSYSFGGDLQSTPNLYQFLASYLAFKYHMKFPPPLIQQQMQGTKLSQNDSARIDAQSKTLMKLVAKHYNKVRGYEKALKS